jgi:hypothetical protein
LSSLCNVELYMLSGVTGAFEPLLDSIAAVMRCAKDCL